MSDTDEADFVVTVIYVYLEVSDTDEADFVVIVIMSIP